MENHCCIPAPEVQMDTALLGLVILSSGLKIKPLCSWRKKIPTLPQLLVRGDGNILDFKPAPPLCTENIFCSISEVSNPLFMAFSSFKAWAGSDLKQAEWQWMFVRRPQIMFLYRPSSPRLGHPSLSHTELVVPPASDNSLISNPSRLKAF